MSPDTKKYRYLALICHTLLLVWVISWQFFLTTTHSYSPVFVALIYVIPLALPYKGVVQGKPYTHAWANFVVLFYLLHAITVIYAVPEEALYGVIELLLCVGMFTGCAVFARKRGRELGLGIKKLKQEMQEERAFFEGE